ncbi:MAG: fasciclin domain-containing protein [Acidimicrobiia bacterium]
MRKLIATGAIVVAGFGSVAPGIASAHNEPKDQTLADILLADSSRDDADGFDHRSRDYDIVTQAVLLFPDLVDAASNSDAELTVFLPNDRAFRELVKDITGEWIRSEADVFAAVASLGTDTVKNVLLYHIVPGSISYRDAKGSDGAVLGTLLEGSSIEVDVNGRRSKTVTLIDADADDRDPRVVQGNVGGAATNGYAHGIDRVLRPIDLP